MDNLSRNIPDLLLPWYRTHARDLLWRRDRQPYHVWVSEIMLQQTRVEAVTEHYRTFLQELPDVQALANVPQDKLYKLWQGLGYYRRADHLKKCAQVIVAQYGGSFPKDYDAIRALPGIGDYTAGAICSICYDQPTPAVDGNVLRVVSRLTADASPIDTQKTKKRITAMLKAIYPTRDAGDFTQSLMELGATICLPNGLPKCEKCPLSAICMAYKENKTLDFPVKRDKKPRRKEEKTVFVFQCGDRYAICRREDEGLLAGLWQFPNLSETLQPQTALHTAQNMGIRVQHIVSTIARTHIFTHVQWDMRCYYMTCDNMPDPFLWVTLEEIQSQYALPTAFAMFLPQAKNT